MTFLIVIGLFLLMRKCGMWVILNKMIKRTADILKDKKILNRLHRAIKEFRKI